MLEKSSWILCDQENLELRNTQNSLNVYGVKNKHIGPIFQSWLPNTHIQAYLVNNLILKVVNNCIILACLALAGETWLLSVTFES